MSIKKKKTILIYQNLPSGGAKRLFESNIKYLNKRYKTNIVSDIFKPNSLSGYLYYAIFTARKIHKIFITNNSSHLVLAYHSWITKAPYILKYSLVPTIYICQEPPREYYDVDIISAFTLKERIINLLRFPIKIIDYISVKTSKELTIVTNSKYSSKKIQEIYNKESVIIYPGINTLEFGKLTKLDERKRNVLCVGAINKLKNQKFILECIRYIPDNEKPYLILIANGVDKDYLKELYVYARKHSIIMKVFINIERSKLVKIYKESSAFIYAPINEPFGIVVLEALNAGLPIIASARSGGYTEILSERNGPLFRGNNPHKWARQIVMLLKRHDKWKKISEYNYKYGKLFSEDIMNKKLSNLINMKMTKHDSFSS